MNCENSVALCFSYNSSLSNFRKNNVLGMISDAILILPIN